MDVLGVKIDEVTMNEALERAETFFKEDKLHLIFTPNPEIIWLAQKNGELREALNSADLTLPDGIGVVLASKILKNPLPERVPGFDFLLELLKKGHKTFLLGSAPGVAEQASQKIPLLRRGGAEHTTCGGDGVVVGEGLAPPSNNIVGTHHGYFPNSETPSIINKINQSGAELLVVAMGAPKQELWLYANRNQLNCKVAIGVGGALDCLAGNVKRAPKIWQKLYLEWLYRAIKQPKRFIRLLSLPKFLLKVITNQ